MSSSSSSSSSSPSAEDSATTTAAAAAKYGARESQIIHTRIRTLNDEEAQLLSSTLSSSPDDSDSESESDSQEFIRPPPPTTSTTTTTTTTSSQPYRITKALFLPGFQSFPHSALSTYLARPWQKTFFSAVSVLLFFSLAIFLPLSSSKGGLIADGAPGNEQIHHLSCTTSLLPFKSCGLDLEDCRPFRNHSFTFRCPAGCETVRVLNPHHVGAEDIVYRPFVIGGAEGRYRGDSFICQAGLHGGRIGKKGGCGKVRVEGEYYRFAGGRGENGMEGIEFDGHFPVSFEVDGYDGVCEGESRWGISFWLVVLGTGFLSWVTTDARVMFWTMVVVGFVWVSLVGDPPDLELGSGELISSLVSIGIGRWLPGLFCLAVVWLFVVRRTLSRLPAEVGFEKAVLWVGGFWIGALVNSTIEPMIPLARLTRHDLEQQPGAVVGLVAVVGLILGVGVVQAYCFWREGRLGRYLIFYGGSVLALALLAMLPGLQLRIHHYILALLLLPGTSMQTRPSLLFQGLLVGIFVNGIARWGFDSLLQTADMLRGDGEYGSLLPVVKDAVVKTLADGPVESISFGWEALPFKWDGVGWDALQGISVTVNDVERYRGWFTERPLEEQVFKWYRGGDMLGRGVRTDEYFRFGFLGERGRVLDYTDAGTWYLNGTWSY
ncbi:hypothetical protein QBC44DRAFT_334709 [Cladorrhinum sp. PSN332]|nr:hypothetical protein QBC44DRAFT_334709 [Cladorrhinum sp. PSN332]